MNRAGPVASVSVTLVTVAMAAIFVVATAEDTSSLMQQVDVTVGDETFVVLVAETIEQKREGLSGRDQMPHGIDGMLFVYDDEQTSPFWMRDTRFALDLAWIGQGGVVLDVITMEPCGDRDDCPTYNPPQPYHVVIETEAGSLDRVDVGDRLSVDGGTR